MTNNQAVHYLESPEYEYARRPQGVRGGLIGLKEERTISVRDVRALGPYLRRVWLDQLTAVDGHADRLCNSNETLCTGDGFRWKPGDPVARFP